ncbi:MAG: ABC transporter permease, partial [Actinobacteria bacterium]|nr:ABC transporter permease [Actinomycetota bacterium]
MNFLTVALTSAVVLGAPLILAALGELFAERSGVLNLSVEGMMLVGAAAGFAITYNSKNAWLGVAAAAVAGAL